MTVKVEKVYTGEAPASRWKTSALPGVVAWKMLKVVVPVMVEVAVVLKMTVEPVRVVVALVEVESQFWATVTVEDAMNSPPAWTSKWPVEKLLAEPLVVRVVVAFEPPRTVVVAVEATVVEAPRKIASPLAVEKAVGLVFKYPLNSMAPVLSTNLFNPIARTGFICKLFNALTPVKIPLENKSVVLLSPVRLL